MWLFTRMVIHVVDKKQILAVVLSIIGMAGLLVAVLLMFNGYNPLLCLGTAGIGGACIFLGAGIQKLPYGDEIQ